MSKIVHGIKFADNVDTSKLKKLSKVSKELANELGKKPKIKITTMVDVDIYDELKRRAGTESDGRYQTFLNNLLRDALGMTGGSFSEIIEAFKAEIGNDVLSAIQRRPDLLKIFAKAELDAKGRIAKEA